MCHEVIGGDLSWCLVAGPATEGPQRSRTARRGGRRVWRNTYLHYYTGSLLRHDFGARRALISDGQFNQFTAAVGGRSVCVSELGRAQTGAAARTPRPRQSRGSRPRRCAREVLLQLVVLPAQLLRGGARLERPPPHLRDGRAARREAGCLRRGRRSDGVQHTRDGGRDVHRGRPRGGAQRAVLARLCGERLWDGRPWASASAAPSR